LGAPVLGRVGDIHRRRQRLVLDLDLFRGDARQLGRIGDDEGDAVADVARLRRLEQGPEGAIALRPAHVLGHEQRRDAAEVLPLRILSRENKMNTIHFKGGFCVDGNNPCMSMRRHDDRPVQHVRQHDVVDVACAAGEEALVFDASYRLTRCRFYSWVGSIKAEGYFALCQKVSWPILLGA
jgi:hypothetical protein